MENSNDKHSITSIQAATFIAASQTGPGLLLLPLLVVQRAGHNGWISVLICGMFILTSDLIIISLCKRFDGSSILEINRIVFGKYFGFFLNILILINIVFITMIQFTIFVTSVALWFFRSTPLLVLALYLSIPSIYITAKGIKAICRLNFLFYLFVSLIMLLVLFNIGNFRITQILPLSEHSFIKVLGAVPASVTVFAGFQSLLLIFPLIKNAKTIKKHVSFAIISTTLIFTVVVFTSIGVFGENLLAKRFSAVSALSRMIKVPILERVDLYFLAAWISGIVLVINAYSFLSYSAIKEVFKIKSKYLPLIIIALIEIVGVLIIKDTNLRIKLLGLSGDLTIYIGIFLPILVLLISIAAKKRGGHKG